VGLTKSLRNVETQRNPPTMKKEESCPLLCHRFCLLCRQELFRNFLVGWCPFTDYISDFAYDY
jgi:hypothetical protein